MSNHLLILVLSAAVQAVPAAQSVPAARPGLPPLNGAPVATAGIAPGRPAFTTLSLRATIDRYDQATRVLSLSTADGQTQVQVPSSVRIRRGWHRLDVSALEKLTGYDVTVRYSEADGSKTLESIHVFDRERTSR